MSAATLPVAFTVTLPLPPSTNNAYRNAGLGRALTAEARAWKQSAAWLVHVDYRDQGKPALSPPLTLSLFLYLPSERRADISNRIKLVEDVLCAALGVDDHHVHELHCFRAVDRQNPRLVAVVRSLVG